MRGVYVRMVLIALRSSGSSPRARGLLCDLADGGQGVRIIPACAGFTKSTRSPRASPADHPRVRGVYRRLAERLDHPDGSSPRARGLRRQRRQGDGPGGIIPACAGFTPASCTPPAVRSDHPRVRGVYYIGHQPRPRRKGSSPRARGLLAETAADTHCARIIPACAGFTRSPVQPGHAEEDHPRVRGVYHRRGHANRCEGGSSPRARGLHVAVLYPLERAGIIPACAGFTAGLGGALCTC
ncbi:Domain of uncharacterised function (DUF2825) [Actinomyces slackii]|uniref:Domain of uncharacterized function (DUF2825) n=1 Tax=Actinomyces slackii TaxID=52774 RepID=A0A3S4SPE8_9ACTO|nr:Domain of uncharacterised function (DUF2825) [Actinomyces slackii]